LDKRNNGEFENTLMPKAKEEDVIRIKEWPTDYARNAYKRKHYIEAIQVLHGFIETKLQELLILTGTIDYKKETLEIWDIANQISLIHCVKVLFILGQISQKEYQSILKFNSMRNQIVHRLFHETYDQGVKGVSKKDFDEVFNQGLSLSDLLQRKTEERIE